MSFALSLQAIGRKDEAFKVAAAIRATTTNAQNLIDGLRWLVAAVHSDKAATESISRKSDEQPIDYDSVLKQFRNVIQYYPDLLLARVLLAESLSQRGRHLEAVETLEAAIAVATPRQIAWLKHELGKHYYQNRELDKAILNYKDAADHPITGASACNNLAWILAIDKNQAEEALPYARRAVELAPESPRILDTAGWVFYHTKKAEEGLKYLIQAKLRAPKQPIVRYHLGMAYLKAGRLDQARSELSTALALSTAFEGRQEAAEALATIPRKP